MLLKRMDEIVGTPQFDLDEGSSDVKLSLYHPSIQCKMKASEEDYEFVWTKVEDDFVSRATLYYNDTPDPSNKLITSWQKFYQSQSPFPENTPYIGGDKLYKSEGPCFGGIAKAAVYLRYSNGFVSWLGGFDPEAARLLRDEVPLFEKILNKNKGKLESNWCKVKPEKNTWALPLLVHMSSGKYLVLGIASGCDDEYDDIEDMGVDVSRSLELMALLQRPNVSGKEMISDIFQMGKGLGRNPFGMEDGVSCPNAEYLRLKGTIQTSTRNELLRCWYNIAKYRMPFAPNPDTSSMLFLPEGDLSYSVLRNAIEEENQRRQLYIELKKKKREKTLAEDTEEIKLQRPSMVPAHSKATVFLVNEEGSQKKKLIVQRIFQGVSVRYFSALNKELLGSNLRYCITQYMKTALTGQDKETPAVFIYWTDVFTRSLQKCSISALPVYANLQRFFRSQSAARLIDEKKAIGYFELIEKLLRLSNLIASAEKEQEYIDSPAFAQELDEIERHRRRPKKGVFEEMIAQIPTGEELLGETYSLLRPKEKSRFDGFVRRAFDGVPQGDFKVFAHGALIGMLLQNLCWCVTKAGRRFSVTQGRHPARLRGAEITNLFTKGMGLLVNLNEESRFNVTLLPFIRSVEAESMQDAFNSGMIMGMVYFESNNGQNAEEEENGK